MKQSHRKKISRAMKAYWVKRKEGKSGKKAVNYELLDQSEQLERAIKEIKEKRIFERYLRPEGLTQEELERVLDKAVKQGLIGGVLIIINNGKVVKKIGNPYPYPPVAEETRRGLKFYDWVILVTLSLAGHLILLAIFGIPIVYATLVGINFVVAGWYAGTRQ